MRRSIFWGKRALIAVATLAMTTLTSAESILDQVNKSGVVRIGTGNDTPPMNYIDGNGDWTGFDVQLGDEIGRRLGVKVERVAVNNRTRIAFLSNRQIDMVLSNAAQSVWHSSQSSRTGPTKRCTRPGSVRRVSTPFRTMRDLVCRQMFSAT